MKNFNLISLILFALLSSLTLAVESKTNPYSHSFSSDREAINFLIKEVKSSQAVFIRNGKEHSSKEAAEHLTHKLKMASKMFWFFGPKRDITLSEFIEKIASKSSTSGKPYQVRLPSGEVITTSIWLQRLLNPPASSKP